MLRFITKLKKSERGASLIEASLLAALILFPVLSVLPDASAAAEDTFCIAGGSLESTALARELIDAAQDPDGIFDRLPPPDPCDIVREHIGGFQGN